jgi:hypothetical protein
MGLRRLLRNVLVGARSLRRRPVRTLLVLQGVIWGVAIAVVPPAILLGSERAAEERSADLGTDRISLRAQPTSPRPWLDLDDLVAVRDRFGATLVAAGGYRVATASVPVENGSVGIPVVGASGDALAARSQSLRGGRAFTEEELREGLPVAILEPEAARLLRGDADPLGAELTLDLGPTSLVVRVVGLTAPRSETATSTDDLGLDHRHPFSRWLRDALGMWGLVPGDDDWKRSETAVVVPLGLLPTTARTGEVDWVILRAAPRDVPETATAIERFLGERGRDVEVGTNMVWPLLASKGLDRYLALNRALFLACLVMGGVVITNLMLLSVLERTREIAIRRTEGAARGDILAQFLGEAFLMGVLGTLVGVPLGLALARVRVALEPVSMLVVEIPWSAIVVVASMAVATSVLAGLLPALRAARLEPVEAMRCD